MRLFLSWRCLKEPSLRWDLHTSHNDLRWWTKPTHGVLNHPCRTFMRATTTCFFRTSVPMMMAVGYSFMPRLYVDFRRVRQPNSGGYQQHVGALFACICTCIEDGRSRATGAEEWMVRDELVISLKQTKPPAWGHLEFLVFTIFLRQAFADNSCAWLVSKDQAEGIRIPPEQSSALAMLLPGSSPHANGLP
jgi:hypothetical protein